MSKKSISYFIKKNCIEYSKKDEFFLGKLPGARYKSQFYLSKLLYNTDMLEMIGEEFVRIVKDEIGHWDFQIAGREWSSIPLLTCLPLHVKYAAFERINSFMIRSEKKTYGIHNWVEGSYNGLPVLIVDDLCNSTNSFIHCHNVITKELKLETLPCIFAVLNKYRYNHFDEEEHEYYDRYLGRSHKALSILTRDDLDDN